MAQGLRRHTVGGQAVAEGVMMRTPGRWAVAVRRPDGGIHTEAHAVDSFLSRHPALARTPLRGPLVLAEAMSVGMRALHVSARVAAGLPSGGERTRAPLAVVMVALLAVLALPAVAVPGGRDQQVLRNAIEGGLRLLLVVGYVVSISRLPDVRRLFGYHGAEHKTIGAYEETGERPTAEAVRAHPRRHVRCGTSFLALAALAQAALVLPLATVPLWWRLVLRAVAVAVAAVLAYEGLRVAASGSAPGRLLALPGLWLQRVTTREPDDGQLEVALASLDALLGDGEPYPPGV